MNEAHVLAALTIPLSARIDKRVPKKLLVENGAPVAADKRKINEGIEEVVWLATLKPTTIGVPELRDSTREYLEIAIIRAVLRATAKASRLAELIHRAIPYPVLLLATQGDALTISLAHKRYSNAVAGTTVLDGSLIVVSVKAESSTSDAFLASLNVTRQPRQHLHAFYQGWIECFEAHAASRLTGVFSLACDSAAAERRRTALAEHERISREMSSLRARACRETQLNRRVELNLQLQQLEYRVAKVVTDC
jgi:hypothetical protein